MTTNSQLSTTEIKKKTTMKTNTKQTTGTRTESEKWRSQGRLSVGRWRERMWGGGRYKE